MIGLYQALENTLDASHIRTILNEHPEMEIIWELRHTLTKPALIDQEDVILHVIFEAIVEQQIQSKEPLLVAKTFLKLNRLGLSRHAARGNIVRLFRWELEQEIAGQKTFALPDYLRKLRFLGQDPDKIGRNQACACGSGKKYKQCCLADAPRLKILPYAGALLLGVDAYFKADTFGPKEKDPILLGVKNRIHLAEYLEKQQNIPGTLLYLQHNVEALKKGDYQLELESSLQDVIYLCLKYPKFSATGLEYIRHLAQLNKEKARTALQNLIHAPEGIDNNTLYQAQVLCHELDNP